MASPLRLFRPLNAALLLAVLSVAPCSPQGRGNGSSRDDRLPVRPAPRGCRSGWAGVPGPFEAVEDQVEPEFELIAAVVAGLQDVLEGQLGDVGVLVGGDRAMIIRARSAVASPVPDGRLAFRSANP